MSNRTLVLLKPDAVERSLVGEILSRFELKGLKILAMQLRHLDAPTLSRHYEEHQGKGFYAELVAFMSRGPVVALALEGPEDTWEIVRAMMGRPTHGRLRQAQFAATSERYSPKTWCTAATLQHRLVANLKFSFQVSRRRIRKNGGR